MDYLTVRQAADRLAMEAETVRRWCRAGRLPATKLPNRTLRIPATEIERILTINMETNKNDKQ